MTDWRSKPRNGRTEFLRHSEEIRANLKDGMTNKQIFEMLTAREDFPLSLSQFNRYVRKYFSDVLVKVRATEEKISPELKQELAVGKVEPARPVPVPVKSSSSDWQNINVRTQRLINDLEENGFTPEIVSSWNEPNDGAIRNRLTQILNIKDK